MISIRNPVNGQYCACVLNIVFWNFGKLFADYVILIIELGLWQNGLVTAEVKATQIFTIYCSFMATYCCNVSPSE